MPLLQLEVEVVGIDLAGSEHRPTGFCVMNNRLKCETKILYSDTEILENIYHTNAKLVSIDAPLSLPKGRKSINNASGPKFRECDLALMRMHIRFFPIVLGPMRMLTQRGIRLKQALEEKGYKVIESYPGGAQDMLGVSRKGEGIEKLRKGLADLGIKCAVHAETDHELDAITCALVGIDFLNNKYLALGDEKEGQIIMPKPAQNSRSY